MKYIILIIALLLLIACSTEPVYENIHKDYDKARDEFVIGLKVSEKLQEINPSVKDWCRYEYILEDTKEKYDEYKLVSNDTYYYYINGTITINQLIEIFDGKTWKEMEILIIQTDAMFGDLYKEVLINAYYNCEAFKALN